MSKGDIPFGLVLLGGVGVILGLLYVFVLVIKTAWNS